MRLVISLWIACVPLWSAAVSGWVLDPSNAPVPGARVEITTSSGSVVASPLTDSSGQFHWDGLPIGSYLVRAEAGPAFFPAVAAAVGDGSPVKLVLTLIPMSTTISVTASRGVSTNVADADGVVTIRDWVELGARPNTSLGTALASSPGIEVQETTPGQVSPILRGLTGYQTLLLFDGVRYNQSTFRSGPNQYLGYLLPAGGARIEASLGPAGATYGSDSMGGTVAVVSPEIRTSTGGRREIHGEVGAMGGSAALDWRSDLVVSIGGRRAALLAGASGQRENALRAGAGIDSRNTLVRYFGLSREQARSLIGERLPGTGYTRFGTNLKVVTRPADNQSLTVLYQHSEIAGERSYRDQWGGPGRVLSLVAPQGVNLAYARYERVGLWRFDSLSGTFSVNSQRDGAARQGLRATDVITTDRGRTDSYGYSVQAATHTGSRMIQVLGVDIYDDHVRATRFLTDPTRGTVTQDRAQYPNGSRYTTAGLFAQNTATFFRDRVRAVAGVRYTGVSFRAYASRNLDASGKQLGVVDGNRSFRDVTFNTALTVRAPRYLAFHFIATRGFRAPNLNDLGGLGLTTLGYDVPVEQLVPLHAIIGLDSSETATSSGKLAAGLKPESLWNYEFGVRFETRRLYARSHVFNAELHDPIVGRTILFPAGQVPSMISGIPVTQISPSAAQKAQGVVAIATAYSPRAVKTSVNDGRTRYYGTESIVRYSVNARIGVDANYSFLAGRDLFPNRAVRRLPPQMGYAGLRWVPTRRFWLATALRFSGSQNRLNAGDIDDERIGASRRRSDIADFFRGDLVRRFVEPGTDGVPGTPDDIFAPARETLAQIQNRVLPIGATVNGVVVTGDSARVPLYLRNPGWWSLDVGGGLSLGEHATTHFGLTNALDHNYRVYGSGTDAPGINCYLGFRYVF